MILWIKALHIISFVSWFAALFYLPRLFVYHVETKTGSEASERFKLMEKRLLKGIINPSLILTLILGILLATYPGVFNLNQIWVWIKIFSFLGILIMHGLFSMHFKKFQLDKNVKSARYFRRCNEIPFIFMMIIVFMVVIKPF